MLVLRSAAVEAVLPLRATRRVGPGATLAHPGVVRHAGAGRRGGRVARGATRGAAVARQGQGGALGGHGGRLPGRVLGRVVVVVGEVGLVGRCVRLAAAGRDAAGWTQAAGVTVAVGAGERQRHDGVDSLGDRKAVLLHLVLGKLTVGCDLDARALQGRGSVRADARRRVEARRTHVLLGVVTVRLGHRDG